MLDFIPIRIWLLFGIAAVGFVPLTYLIRHFAASPSRRDITQPPQELAWRSTRAFAQNAMIVAACAALALFIFTPTAEDVANSDLFFPSLMALFGGFALFSTVRGFANGRIQPLVRGFYNTYERSTQPKRFWASLVWNALLGAGILAVTVAMLLDLKNERCFNAKEDAAKAKLAACSDLLAEGGGDRSERARLFAERGIAYHWLGNYDAAKSDYSQAVSLNAKDATSFYNRSLLYARAQDPAHTLSDLSSAIALDPKNTDALARRGELFLIFGNPQGAIADLSRVRELDHQNLDAVAQRGFAYAMVGNGPAATADFTEVRQTRPNHPLLVRGQIVLLAQTNQEPRAIALLTKLLDKAPDDMWALRARADLLWQAGRRDEAAADDDRLNMLMDRARALRGGGDQRGK